MAYWNKFSHLPKPARNGLGFPDTWWWDADKAARLKSQ
jgi:hypothetical protein